MKKESRISAIVGLTQEQMAMLLKITRSQWSLYELGKRDLPLEAKQFLAELLTHAKDAKAYNNKLNNPQQQEKKTQQALEKLLKENEYQQIRQAKKITAMEKKYAAATRAFQLVDFLSKHSHNKVSPTLIESIAAKATSQLKNNGLTELMQEQMKQEILQFEKKLLNTALQNNIKSKVKTPN